jgi:hypothetical protein
MLSVYLSFRLTTSKADISVIPLHRHLWNLFGVSFYDRIYIRADDRLSFGSFALAFYLPGFVNRMKDFGAGFEMQERLAVFQEINFMRTLSRVAYSICFVCPLTLCLTRLIYR